jgi:hypothetical protein
VKVIYKHGRLEKKLREHGRAAPAEILSMRREGRGSGFRAMRAADDDLTAGWTLCRMQLRVMPEGEPPFETTVRTRLNTFKYKGDVVPVLYDPADHDKVVVDYESDARATMENAAALRSAAQSPAAKPAERGSGFADDVTTFGKPPAAVTETLAAIMRATESGDQAEVERLKAEFTQRAPGDPGTADQGVVGGPSANAPSDPLERLQKLADLHDRGVLTDAEFAAEKAKILSES